MKKDVLIAASKVVDHDTHIFSSTDIVEEGPKFVFGFSRIARLKGRFYDSLYQQVINYKARIDLNLIEQAVATNLDIDLILRYKNTDIRESIKTTLIRIKPAKDLISVSGIGGKSAKLSQMQSKNTERLLLGKKMKLIH
ncbi:hypothetical protein [Pedobacter panaciterrae]